MDLLGLINETLDKGIDLLGLIKLMKEQLVRIANENASLKAQLVEKEKVIESLTKKDAKDG